MPAQFSFNRVAVLYAIFQKPKNNLYDTVFEYVIRLWSYDIRLCCCFTAYLYHEEDGYSYH
jgi:hypothetical protein